MTTFDRSVLDDVVNAVGPARALSPHVSSWSLRTVTFERGVQDLSCTDRGEIAGVRTWGAGLVLHRPR